MHHQDELCQGLGSRVQVCADKHSHFTHPYNQSHFAQKKDKLTRLSCSIIFRTKKCSFFSLHIWWAKITFWTVRSWADMDWSHHSLDIHQIKCIISPEHWLTSLCHGPAAWWTAEREGEGGTRGRGEWKKSEKMKCCKHHSTIIFFVSNIRVEQKCSVKLKWCMCQG